MHVYSYSRKILWLRVATTSKDHKVILLYYLLSVFIAEGKKLLKSDRWFNMIKFVYLRGSQTHSKWLWDGKLLFGCLSHDAKASSWWWVQGSEQLSVWIIHYKYSKLKFHDNDNIIDVELYYVWIIWWTQLRNSVTDYWINIFKV